jgi:transposase-like protein
MPGVPVSASMARRLSLPALWLRSLLAGTVGAHAVPGVWSSDVGDGGYDFPRHAQTTGGLVPGHVLAGEPEEWGQCSGVERVLGLGSYKTAWTWLHKFRRAMVRPSRDRLSGRVEVDETYLGGLEEGKRGRQTERKSLIVIAAQEDGPGIGRIRMKRIADASAESLIGFVQEAIEPGSTVHTDGWVGYIPLEESGYDHEITILKGKKQSASELMPRVHRIASLLKRWILGTHQGAVSHEHLEYYLDEFTFRFNRRRSANRGKLFYRLVQQAVAADPVPYKSMIKCGAVGADRDHNL